MAFVPSSRTFEGSLILQLEPSAAFPLFSPDGERAWVPGWQPEILYPPETLWAEGQVFRTRDESGEAVWIVAELDMISHHVVYYRVQATRYVAKVEVNAKTVTHGSEVSVSYAFVGLSDSGNEEIEAMSQAAYDEKLRRWSQWLDTYIAQRNK